MLDAIVEDHAGRPGQSLLGRKPEIARPRHPPAPGGMAGIAASGRLALAGGLLGGRQAPARIGGVGDVVGKREAVERLFEGIVVGHGFCSLWNEGRTNSFMHERACRKMENAISSITSPLGVFRSEFDPDGRLRMARTIRYHLVSLPIQN